MSRPDENDRPVFANPRPVNPFEPRLKDITPQEMTIWESMAPERNPEHAAEVEALVERAIEEARSASGRVLKSEANEPERTLEDYARAAKANKGTPSGRQPQQVWGTGAGRTP